MPDSSENTLAMSIQTIHQIAAQNSVDRDAATGPEQADYDEIIEAGQIAANELRVVYEKTRAEGADLSPYASLVSQEEARPAGKAGSYSRAST